MTPAATPTPPTGIDLTRTALGIEFGSTRIKAVLTDPSGAVLASGGHTWENSLVDGVWTYSIDEVETGLRAAYAALAKDLRAALTRRGPVSSRAHRMMNDKINRKLPGPRIRLSQRVTPLELFRPTIRIRKPDTHPVP